MFFALLMCVLNGLAIRKYLHYRQEIRRTFLIPGVSSLIMALAVWLAYTPLASLMGGKPAVVVCLALAVLIYGFFVLFLRGITEEELRAFPKGQVLVKALKKVRTYVKLRKSFCFVHTKPKEGFYGKEDSGWLPGCGDSGGLGWYAGFLHSESRAERSRRSSGRSL